MTEGENPSGRRLITRTDARGRRYCEWVDFGSPTGPATSIVPEERLPRGVVTASEIRDELLKGRVTPALAATSIKKIFEKEGLDEEEAYSRIEAQHQFFSDSNEPLSQVQGVRWDNFVICIGQSLEIPEERRIRERLVPVGTPSVRDDFADLAF